jgi:MoxR-like ATPase
VATQNPIELEGTFPLPEAQLDRFMMRLSLGYPTAEDEAAMVRRFLIGDPLVELEPVTDPEELAAAIVHTQRIFLGQAVLDYLVALVRQTRQREDVQLGASRARHSRSPAARRQLLSSLVVPTSFRTMCELSPYQCSRTASA